MRDKPNKDIVYVTPRAYEFTYYLSDCVQDTHEYHDLLQTLDNAGENDLIRIVINNYGGEVGTTTQLVSHIRESKAIVVGHISGNAFSAAGVIWLACHQQEVSDHCMLMIHSSVGFAEGKYVDMAAYIKAANRRTELLYKDIFEFFLTEEEIDKVLRGEEVWMLADEIVERLENRQKLFEAEEINNRSKEQSEFEALFNEPEIPQEALAKLTKAQLISYIKGDVDVVVAEDGSVSVVAVDNEDLE
jgi:ATP-dependent protease ClpP protease subunit